MELFSFSFSFSFFWWGLEKPFQGKALSIAFVFAPLLGWSLRHSAPAFLPGIGIVPSSWARHDARRVSWKWSFYYLRSASPSKPVRPYTKAQPSVKKTNCPHSLLYCTPNPCSCVPRSAPVGENAASRRQRDWRSQVRSARDAHPRQPGLKQTHPDASPGAAEAGEGAEGGRESWWLCVFPVIAMGIGKGTWLICLLNYASLLCAALPASNLYYSRCLNQTTSPLLAWMLLSDTLSGKPWRLIAVTT